MHQPVFARSILTAEQIFGDRDSMRCEVMELVAGSLDTLANSRALLEEADALFALDKLPRMGTKRLPDKSA